MSLSSSHNTTTTLANTPRPMTSSSATTPHDLKRRAHILDTACSLIQSYGYHRTTMDNIARCAGMSKKTLYLVFPSKKALIEQLLLDRLFTPLQLTPDMLPSADPESQLLDIMLQLARHMMDEKFLGLMRAIIGETTRSPAIAQLMTELFHLSGKKFSIRQWLIAQKEAGLLSFDNADDVADHLFGLTVGVPFLSRLSHCSPPRDEAHFRTFLQNGIRIFLTGYRATPQQPHSPPASQS